MKKNLVSIAAAQASRYIKLKRPSNLIPFIGNFPLLEENKYDDYDEVIYKTQYVEDCPEWVQNLIIKGQQMFLVDKAFEDYLLKKEIKPSDFLTKKNSDKATELIKFLEENSLTLNSLKF